MYSGMHTAIISSMEGGVREVVAGPAGGRQRAHACYSLTEEVYIAVTVILLFFWVGLVW